MTRQSKYLVYAVGMMVSIFIPVLVAIILTTCLSISFESSIIVGLIIAVPLFVYCVVKMVQCNKMQPDKSAIGFSDSHSPASLPDKPVYVDKNSAFVFANLKDEVKWYFEDLWETNMEYGWVDVLYAGNIVLQIWNVP